MDPWYKVVTPRKEVREGRSFNPDEFAIALEQVVAGTAPEDYNNPEKFFSRTYFSRALRDHVGMVLRRLSGKTESKASFFLRFGFTVADWQRLAEALIRHASENEVVEMKETSHGRRYVVDGPLTAPDRTSLNVRTAWYINPSGDAPRFVTAHPLPKL